jgi:hypothetical protein
VMRLSVQLRDLHAEASNIEAGGSRRTIDRHVRPLYTISWIAPMMSDRNGV